MNKLNAGAKKLGLHLTPEQLEQFEVYYQELVAWNQRVNLTAITDYEEVQIKHFLDSLTVTLAWPQQTDLQELYIIDVGTGGGLPGIPIKLLFPRLKLVLLDSMAKKGAFLYHVIRKLKMDKVEIVIDRAENAAHNARYREQFDIVLSRATAHLPTLVELTVPFCTIGGTFIAQKKGDTELEIREASNVISLLGSSLREVKGITLEELADDRRLVIIDKISTTPKQYPRRSGIPAKRPVLDKPLKQ